MQFASQMDKNRVFFALLILGMAFMGLGFVFVKDAVGDHSPFVFLFYRFLIATVVLTTLSWKQLAHVSFSQIRAAFLCGLLLLLSILCQTIGLQYTSVSNSAFITGMVVLVVPLLKWIIYQKKVKAKVWAACIIALLGLYLITIQNGLSLNVGDVWTVACTLSLAFYVLVSAQVAHQSNPMIRVSLIMALCTIVSLTGMLTTPNEYWLPQDYGFWKSVGFTALLGTVYMYTVQTYAQRYIQEEKVALAYLTEPLFAVLAAYLFLNEAITLYTLLGGAFILIAMFLAEAKIQKRKKGMVMEKENQAN